MKVRVSGLGPSVWELGSGVWGLGLKLDQAYGGEKRSPSHQAHRSVRGFGVSNVVFQDLEFWYLGSRVW